MGIKGKNPTLTSIFFIDCNKFSQFYKGSVPIVSKLKSQFLGRNFKGQIQSCRESVPRPCFHVFIDSNQFHNFLTGSSDEHLCQIAFKLSQFCYSNREIIVKYPRRKLLKFPIQTYRPYRENKHRPWWPCYITDCTISKFLEKAIQ